jgi:hypothetical protein
MSLSLKTIASTCLSLSPPFSVVRDFFGFSAPPPQTLSLKQTLNSLNAWARLNFTMQHQQQTNWCWAATSVSVSAYFNPATTWTQCKLVNAEFGRADCCTNGSSTDCNRGVGSLGPYNSSSGPLTKTGNLTSCSWAAGSKADIAREIIKGLPLCVGVYWSGGGGHALAIIGLNCGLNMVAVADPWYGSSDWTLAAFTTAYQGTGQWVLMCFVKS